METTEADRKLAQNLAAMANALSTGFPAADEALSGGFPRGKLTAIQGTHAVRIPTLRAAVSAAQQARSPRLVVAWVDCAGLFSVREFTAAGIELDRILVSQPDTAEQALEIVAVLARSGAVDLVVVDAADSLFTGPMVEALAGHARHGAAAVVLGVQYLASAVEICCSVTVSLSTEHVDDPSHVDMWLRRHAHALGDVPSYTAPVAWVDASEPAALDYDPSDPALLVNILRD